VVFKNKFETTKNQFSCFTPELNILNLYLLHIRLLLLFFCASIFLPLCIALFTWLILGMHDDITLYMPCLLVSLHQWYY